MADFIKFGNRRYKVEQVVYLNGLEEMIEAKTKKDLEAFKSGDDPNPVKFHLNLHFGEEDLGVFVFNGSTRKIYIVRCCFTLLSKKLFNGSAKLLEYTFEKHFLEQFDKSNNNWGFPKFIEISELRECFDSNLPWEVKLKCEVTYTGELKEDVVSKQISSNDILETQDLSRDFIALFETETDTDVVFSISEKEIKAHRLILKARSLYFKRLFDSGMKESTEKVIKVEDCPFEEYRDMIHFLYTDLPPKNIEKNASSLLPIADKYLIPKLKRYCEKSLKDHLTDENLKEFLLLSHQFNCPVLKEACFAKIPNFKVLSEWDELKDCGDLLMEYMKFL